MIGFLSQYIFLLRNNDDPFCQCKHRKNYNDVLLVVTLFCIQSNNSTLCSTIRINSLTLSLRYSNPWINILKFVCLAQKGQILLSTSQKNSKISFLKQFLFISSFSKKPFFCQSNHSPHPPD